MSPDKIHYGEHWDIPAEMRGGFWEHCCKFLNGEKVEFLIVSMLKVVDRPEQAMMTYLFRDLLI